MNARNQILVRGLVSLAVVWGVVFLIAKVAGSMKPTAEKIQAFQEKNPLSEIEDPEKRIEHIAKVADMLNQMEASEVEKLNVRDEGDPRRDFLTEMSGEEQLFFLERRVGRAFEQMMQSFNEMDREERKKIVERSLRRIRENQGEGDRNLETGDPEIVEKIAEAGFKAYYSEASAETKIDLAPLMEEMQGVMGQMRGPRR
ncbi:MAG: hypothetical protein ABF384_10550 [Verrucomicrobiales bacterium]|jgi:hypothetical protein|nr:hypothetical protein [bacterium]